MSQNLRARFYDLRHKLDKQKNNDFQVGLVALQSFWELLPDMKGLAVLDAGVGTGWASQAFAAREPAMLYGVDISPQRVKELQVILADSGVPHRIEQGSIERLDMIDDAELDFIQCRDVIEHVDRPREALAEFRRTLKTGGLLLLQTPNDLIHSTLKLGHYSFRLMESLISSRDVQNDEDDPFLMQDSRHLEGDDRVVAEEARAEDIHEHEQMWQPTEFIALLKQAGFCCEQLTGTPLFSSNFFQLGRTLTSLSSFYCEWAGGENHHHLAEALADDMLALGRIDEETRALPVEYVISDDLIVLARKV